MTTAHAQPAQRKQRTITLTGRAPVRIHDDEWPVIAEAAGDSWSGTDPGRYRQALHQGECDTYTLKVRQHADGRTIVYAILSAAIAAWHQPAGGEDHKGGEILNPPGDPPWAPEDGRAVSMHAIAQAIQRVGRECGLPDSVIRACIADLPAEVL